MTTAGVQSRAEDAETLARTARENRVIFGLLAEIFHADSSNPFIQETNGLGFPDDSIDPGGGATADGMINCAGFDQAGACQEPSDRFSSELKFMEALASKETVAWHAKNYGVALQCLSTESKFMDEHLAGWIVVLSRKLFKMSNRSFPRDVIRLIAQFLDTEIKDIQRRLKFAVHHGLDCSRN